MNETQLVVCERVGGRGAATAETLKELYEETLASQIKVWDDEIEHLEARVDIIMAQIEDRCYCLLKGLRTRENELKGQLASLRAVSPADDRQNLTNAIACATGDMKRAIAEAVREIEGLSECLF